MRTVSFNGLLIISVIAVMAPVLVASVKRVKLPSVVVEITAGVIVGPSVLGWVVAAGFLQATSLPVIVTAASIGLAIHAIAPVTASALVAAGLLSVLVFPLAALSVIRTGHIEPAAPYATPPDRGGRGTPPAFDDQPVQKEG